MAFDVQGARKAGYSDAEIANFLAKERRFDAAAARKAGYSDGDIVAHLTKVNPLADVGQSLVAGLKQGAANVADIVAGGSPLGPIGRASVRNPFGLPNPMNMAGNLFAREVEKRSYKPQTTAGEYARTIGQNVPNAIAPGSAPARVANVFAPAIASETAGQVARRVGAGPKVEAAARVVGSVAGAGAASVRLNPRAPRTPAGTLGGRARQNPADMRARAQQFRDANIEPTLVDVVDDAGRGVVKAAASRAAPGRQVANDFADGRALNMPDRVSGQARRHMSQDPRTPDQIRQEVAAQRRANADQAFGAVRGDTMEMAPETVQALRTPHGRDAIAEAARRERDPEIRAALNRLANDALDAPNTPITVGMADRISRTLHGWGNAARRNGDDDLAATYTQLAEGVRNPARQASPGYQSALEGYAADSRLGEAVDVGERLMTPDTDGFVPQANALAGPERELALAAGRRAVERKVGENVSAAPGVARRLAYAPEQQARNAALMGPERANAFQSALGLETRALENAQRIAPGRGSPTHLNASDEARLEGAISLGNDLRRQGVVGTVVGRGLDWLRSRGISDEQAEALVRMATDPRQTDQAIAIIERALGPNEARQFVQWRNAAMLGAASATMGAAPAPQQQPTGQPQ